MGAFDGIDIARTGVGFSQFWIETLAHNLSNANTVTATDEEPFRAHMLIARNLTDEIRPTGSGVKVASIEEDPNDAPLLHDPDHPLADEDGFVQGAVMDLAGNMTDLIQAQRSLQASARAIQSATEAYQSALQIGQR